MNNTEEIQNILLESVWITRWNDDKTALYAILEPDEAVKITEDIINNLKEKGYEIKKANQ